MWTNSKISKNIKGGCFSFSPHKWSTAVSPLSVCLVHLPVVLHPFRFKQQKLRPDWAQRQSCLSQMEELGLACAFHISVSKKRGQNRHLKVFSKARSSLTSNDTIHLGSPLHIIPTSLIAKAALQWFSFFLLSPCKISKKHQELMLL